MNLTTDMIGLAHEKKFSEFSTAIKNVMKSKMNNHEVSIAYKNEYDDISRMKDLFSQVANPEGV